MYRGIEELLSLERTFDEAAYMIEAVDVQLTVSLATECRYVAVERR